MRLRLVLLAASASLLLAVPRCPPPALRVVDVRTVACDADPRGGSVCEYRIEVVHEGDVDLGEVVVSFEPPPAWAEVLEPRIDLGRVRWGERRWSDGSVVVRWLGNRWDPRWFPWRFDGVRQPGPDPVVEAKAQAVADTWLATEPPESVSWDWGEGVLAFGLLELAEVTGESRYRDYVRAYVAHHRGRGVEYAWIDHVTPALAAALVALRTGDDVEPLLADVDHFLFEEVPRTAGGGIRHHGIVPVFFVADLWVDSLFHFVPLLGRLHARSGEARFLDLAAEQLLVFAATMQDPATDLFTHAYIDAPDEIRVPTFEERSFWARGNGWVLAALVDCLAVLPREHPAYAELQDRARRLARALRALQAPDGRFHTVLHEAETDLETAGSCLITYAMARGARIGLFGPQARLAARSGMDGLLGVLHEAETGLLVGETSLGTIPSAALYPVVPLADQLPYGVGAWLLAASEFLH